MVFWSVNTALPDSLVIWNVLAFVVAAATFLLPVAALFSIWEWRDQMETTHVLIWAAIVIFAPFVGSIVWFAAGKRLHPDRVGLTASHPLR